MGVESRAAPISRTGAQPVPIRAHTASARTAARHPMGATFVQRGSKPAATMELCGTKVCIALAPRDFFHKQPTIQGMLLAERLVGEARQRRASEMDRRERRITSVSALLFLAAAIAMAVLLPDERNVDPLLT